MLSDDMKNQLLEKKEIVLHLRTQMNHVFDTSLLILNFLIQNKDSWKVEDGQIQFLTEDLYNQYMSYVNQLSQ